MAGTAGAPRLFVGGEFVRDTMHAQAVFPVFAEGWVAPRDVHDEIHSVVHATMSAFRDSVPSSAAYALRLRDMN
jgi:hypothetical protein